MNKKEKLFIINYLQKKLDESEKMWVEGVSRPQIVGFLQGSIGGLIQSLEE
jgi:hypothetical protein